MSFAGGGHNLFVNTNKLLFDPLKPLADRHNLGLSLDVHLVIEVRLDAVLLGLPALAHHDEYREKNRFEADHHGEQSKWVGIKRLDPKKKSFLENYVKIYDYRPLTPPIVGAIIFDKDMEYAMIQFGMIMQGGIAFLKKESGKWVIISAKTTSRE